MSDPALGLYHDPALYDILYGPDTWREVDALERIERRVTGRRRSELRPDRLWFEPACGSGRYLRVAAGRGRRSAGFDLSEDMLAYATQRRLRPGASAPRYFRADMADFLEAAARAQVRPGSVDFAFNPVNSIRHLESDRRLLAHLEQMARILRPGAPYVVGISLTDYGFLLEEEDLWTAARGSCRVSQLVNYLPAEPGTERARSEQVVSHLTVERPGGVEHLDHTYSLRTYDRDQWRRILRKSPLNWAGTYDARGRLTGDGPHAYQYEVLVRPRA